MKFDFIIGNPPYQEKNENNSRKSPIYNLFMDASHELADVVELITPARFLFEAGQTPKAWNKKMLNDEHFKVLEYSPDASKIFPNTDIKGGVAISIRNNNEKYGAIGVFTAYPELNDIVKKVRSHHNGEYLDSVVSVRGCYRTTEKFFLDYPFASSRLGAGTGNMIASNFFEKVPEVYEESVTNTKDYYQFLCRISNKRTKCYIKKEYVLDNEYLNTYNVATPKSNGSGVFGEALASTEIIKPDGAATDTFVNIGMFTSLFEAESLSEYIKTKFLRALLGVKKVTQDNPRSVWGMIPLQDFSSDSDIDWSKSISEIDQQLYRKYDLSDEEIEFIEKNVKEME